MAHSAFGVDHGEVSKAEEKKASAGRHAAAQFFPGAHGLAAGKPGKALRAAGHELGGNLGGTLVGGAVGGLTRNPAAAGLGGIAGSTVGTSMGVSSAQRKGYYRAQKKKKKGS